MAISINTNVASLNAQRNLNNSQGALNKAMQRLSSGLRINSAKDDAAGLAISERMNSQVRGINQAVRNANDGISLAQTAEGAMNEVTNILQRMRELSVQASNDTYSSSDRASLQGEMDQLYQEIDRIASSTQFNGISLLDGTGGTRTMQVGANAGEEVTLKLSSVKTQDLNLNGYSALGELNSGRVGDVTTQGLKINGVSIAAAGAGTAQSAATAINAKTGDTGVTATAYNVYKGVGNVSGITDGSLTINGNTIAASGNMQELVANINRDAAGVTATLDKDGAISLSNDTGANIVVGGTVTNTGLVADTYTGYISLKDKANEAIKVEAHDTAANLARWGFNESNGSADVTGGAVTNGALAVGDLLINGTDVGAVTGTSAGDKAAAINALSSTTGVIATAKTEQTFTLDITNLPGVDEVRINGTAVDLSAVTNLEDVITEINGKVQGVVASGNEDGELVLTSASGLDITVEQDAGDVLGVGGGPETYRGKISLTSEKGADIVITGNNTDKAGFAEQGGNSEAIGKGLSLESVANANNSISRIDDALSKVADIRGVMGAAQNRLESTIANLQNVGENISSARSRILDADIASETSAMIKNNILQQAGVSILVQANQAPQMALSLLQ